MSFAGDRRVVRVFLTKKALDVESEMFTETSRWSDRLAAGLTPKNREALINLLLRVEHHVHRMLDEMKDEDEERLSTLRSSQDVHRSRTSARVRRTEAGRA